MALDSYVDSYWYLVVVIPLFIFFVVFLPFYSSLNENEYKRIINIKNKYANPKINDLINKSLEDGKITVKEGGEIVRFSQTLDNIKEKKRNGI